MPGKNSKFRIVVTFATMLVMAMLLQGTVNVFLGLRSSVREDIHWVRLNLERFVPSLFSIDTAGEMRRLFEIALLNEHNPNLYSCVTLEIDKRNIVKQGSCKYGDTMHKLSGQAREQGREVVDFAGSGWYSLLSLSEAFLIAVPLVGENGQVVATITAERSLLPIYSRFGQDLRILLGYLAINTLLFTILFFVRIQNMFFRPLDRLVEKADSYHQDTQPFSLISEDESPFRRLSSKLNTLFARIESDNRMLRSHVRELEQVNAELKAKNDLIIRSEKLASVGRLSAGLAHEIGNPLSIIQGYVELLSRDDLSSEEKQQFSEKAQHELDRIQRLIRQLLNFAGSKRSVCEAVSVNELIREVVDFVSMEKSEGESFLHTDLHAVDDGLFAERDALRQVLINCLLNAVDATAGLARGERDIAISTANEQGESGEARLVIRIDDNGTGIGEDELQYVFDPFYTTKEVGRGTGLGLFVSNAIVEGLGGTIRLCNREREGVEVTISFGGIGDSLEKLG